MEKLSALLMVAGRSAPRYQKMALLYPQSKLLQSNLSEYFIVVVRLCHHLLKVTKKTLFVQLVSFFSDSQIKDYESELLRWASAIKEEANFLLNENIDDQGSRVKRLLKDTVQYQKTKANCHLLDSCSTHDYETTWKEIRKAGNVTLLSSNPEYHRWRSEIGSSTLLWKGKLGAGKSVLLANIVDDLNFHAPNSHVPVTYLFCRHDIPESLTARTVIGSLARQLLRSVAHDTAQVAIDATAPNLDCERLLGVLKQALPSSLRAYFVLDGLDECDEKERVKMIRHIQTLQRMFGLLVCLSFRVEAGTTLWLNPDMFTNPTTLTIPEDNPDIARFISSQLERSIESAKLKVGDPAIIFEIEDALLRGSQGMFLWVTLQIDTLYTSKTDAAIREALADLPKDLPETFNRIVQRSGKLGNEYQIRIFKLVVAALRPLSVEELRGALSVAPGDATWNPALLLNDIYSALACCGSLITINEEALTIKLIHHSVKQFLLGGSVSFPSGLFTADSANQAMGEIIVTYLNYGVFVTNISRMVVPNIVPETSPSTVVKSMDTTPSVKALTLKFLRSRRQPGYNMGKTMSEAVHKRPSNLQDQFFFHSYANDHWLDHVMLIRIEEQAFCNLVTKLITKYPSPNHIASGSGGEQRLLWWAAKSGHGEIVRVLLDAGADLEVCDAAGMTPLCSAVWAEQSHIVDLLLDRGARLDSSTSLPNLDLEETPLILAILRKNHPIASTLLCRGADPNEGSSVAQIYSRVQNSFKNSPLFEGHLKFICHIRRGQRNLPLVLAIAAGDEPMVKLLLDHRANVHPQPDELDPLQYAVQYRHTFIMGILLAHGAPVNPSEYLLPAIGNHDAAMVRVLLENGAEWESTEADNSNPIFLAIGQDQDEILRLLLEKRSRVKRSDMSRSVTFGTSPFIAALENGNVNILKTLLEFWEGPDLVQVVREVVAWENDTFLRLVLEKGAEIHFPVDQSRATLSYAISIGSRTGLHLLAKEGADVHYVDNEGRTPFSYACEIGFMIINELIKVDCFDFKSQLDKPDKGGRTPLSYAAQCGYTGDDSVVSYLLKHRANPNYQDNNGCTPLIYAASARFPNVVKCLLDGGAKPNLQTPNHSPLVSAIMAGCTASVRLLIYHGADVWATDMATGLLPLAVAEHEGNHKIAENIRQQMRKRESQWSLYLRNRETNTP